MSVRDLVLQWYVLLSGGYAAVALPLRAVGDGAGIPALSALLFGLMGAAAPCQLTTNAGALAFIGRRASGPRHAVLREAGAYVLGKTVTYALLGGVVVATGRQALPVPAIVLARRLLGPAMVVLGLYLLGRVRLSFTLGGRLSAWVERRAGGGAAGAFILGIAFSLAFCPTLFLLFFGLTVPLALGAPVGLVGLAYPALFALGAGLPLLALAGALGAGSAGLRAALGRGRRWSRWLRPLAGLVLLVAGLHDTLVYWLL